MARRTTAARLIACFQRNGLDSVGGQLLTSFWTGFNIINFVMGKVAKVSCQPASHFSAGSEERYIHGVFQLRIPVFYFDW